MKLNDPQINLKHGVAGRFKIEAVRPDGTRRVLADWFDNLILDAGLNRMGTGACTNWCQVGSGSTAPAVTDTALVSRVAGTSTIQATNSGNAPSAPWYGYTTTTYRFALGAAAGNLSEVGVGWATSGSLFSRALIRDLAGDPTTITVLSDEILDVSYQLRLYSPVADQTFDWVISGVTYSVVLRASLANTTSWAVGNIRDNGTTGSIGQTTVYTGAIGTVIQQPSGTSLSSTSTTASAYVNNSLERNFTSYFDLNSGNIGGVKSIYFGAASGWGGAYQAQVTPNIPKDATKVMNLRFKISWNRYTP